MKYWKSRLVAVVTIGLYVMLCILVVEEFRKPSLVPPYDPSLPYNYSYIEKDNHYKITVPYGNEDIVGFIEMEDGQSLLDTDISQFTPFPQTTVISKTMTSMIAFVMLTVLYVIFVGRPGWDLYYFLRRSELDSLENWTNSYDEYLGSRG